MKRKTPLHRLKTLCLLPLLLGCQTGPLQPEPVLSGRGAQLAFSLRPAAMGGFRLQAAKQLSDVAYIRYCLLEASASTSPVGGAQLSPVSSVFQFQMTSRSQANLKFTNLRANAPGMAYYIAVAAYDSADNNITNNTGSNSDAGRVTIAGETGNFYLSTSGGGGNSISLGSVRVMPVTYEISSTNPLGVALKLADDFVESEPSPEPSPTPEPTPTPEP